ncbi:helix-turn-helix domain-containing protein [Bifidobacterium pseudolongum]|uniref:helix-turn-helix domain-containing protein n=1 Tax=Bifidobacterium pseudolongum TaxID=1694 RepID=UPI00101FD53E|nr:helix-turn-helix transcriptional regulator [Bifidobacterium pseudolongum]
MTIRHDTQDELIVSSYLRELRKSKGVSQETLASLLGEGQSVISKYENAQRKLTAAEFLRIVVLLEEDPQKASEELSRRLGL